MYKISLTHTTEQMKSSNMDFLSECEPIRRKLIQTKENSIHCTGISKEVAEVYLEVYSNNIDGAFS